MDCIVQDNSGGTAKESEEEEEVTFLYRLCSGSSPKSYGINVAKLARLPAEVIALAMKQSREFEQRMKGGEEAVLATDDARNVLMSRDLTLAYFERLVSIAHSNVCIQDLTYLASEMWRRYRSM
jgi:DNA mismatch repair ATPase MutS